MTRARSVDTLMTGRGEEWRAFAERRSLHPLAGIDLAVVVAVLALERLGRGPDEERGRRADDDERDDPAEAALGEEPGVDALAALEEADGDRGADLAMSGTERPALARPVDDDEGRAQLDARAARRRDGRQLDAHGVHDLVAVRRQAHHDASTTERQDPQHDLGGHLLLRADLALLVREVGGREGAHGVRDVVGAVREPGWKSSSESGYRRCSTAWGARI